MIITFIISFALSAIISYVIIRNWIKNKQLREAIEFANKPKEELLEIALVSPFYAASYNNMKMVMSEEKAADFLINKMLIDNRIIGFRKTEL